MDENILNNLPDEAAAAVSEGAAAAEAAETEVLNEAAAPAIEAVNAVEAAAPAFEAPAAPAAPAFEAPAAPVYEAPAAPAYAAPAAPAAPAFEAPAAPVYEAPAAPAYAAPAAPAYEAPAAPAYAAPAYEAPAYQAAPAAPAYGAPAYGAPAYQAAPVYTPAPEFNQPKKKKKTGLIVGLCIAAALIALALLWFLVLSPSGITLSKDYTSFEIGDSVVLTATVNPGSAINKDVTWSSSDTSVATVSEDGKVTGVYPGTCTITAATSNGKTATCRVEVTMSTYDAVVLGEWRCTYVYDCDSHKGYDPRDLGSYWYLSIKEDHTLVLTLSSDYDHVWEYSKDYEDNYVYSMGTSSDYFLYITDSGEIWYYVGNYCLTFEK